MDVSQLQVSPERVAGSITAQWPIGKNAKAMERTYKLDLALKDGRAAGAYTGGDGQKSVPPCELADVRRVEWPEFPATVHWELALATGRGAADAKEPRKLGLALRCTTIGGKAAAAWVYATDFVNGPGRWEHPLAHPAGETHVVFKDGQLSGVIKHPAFTKGLEPYEVEFTARVVGLRLGGTAKVRQAGKEWSSPVTGIASIAAELNHRPPPQKETWPWTYTAKPDATLLAEAVRQANEPLFPGDPKGREFWSWRALIRGGRIDCIHPPSFDIQEMPGAVKYRIALSDREKTYSCEVDKPWRPLTALWKDLPYGQYNLSVTGLDAGGKALDAQPQFRWWKLREKKEELGPDEQWRWNRNHNCVQWDYKGKAVIKPLDRDVVVLKRRPFDGPYFDRLGDVTASVLRAARYSRDIAICPHWRALLPFIGFQEGVNGPRYMEHGGGVSGFGAMLCAALSADPWERTESALLADTFGNWYLNARQDVGLVVTYGSYIPTRTIDYLLLSRLRSTLPGPKYDEATRDFMKRILVAQLADGSFGGLSEKRVYPCKEPPGWYLPGGVYLIELDRYNPGSLLYVLGRYRHEMKSEEFAAQERLSLQYLRKNLTGDFFWPEHGSHSQTAAYPAPIHGIMLEYFCLYLLEYARPEDRDPALVEQLALWCEDRNIRWERSGAGEAQVRPSAFGSGDSGRSGGRAAENVARVAHLYARLWQATGKPLHRAKSEALLGALLASQSPETGYITPDVEAKTETDLRSTGSLQPSHHYMWSYGVTLTHMLSAAETLAAREKGNP